MNTTMDNKCQAFAARESELVTLARRISSRLKRSRRWDTLKLEQTAMVPWRQGGMMEVEYWGNTVYAVTVRRFKDGWILDAAKPWAQLGIHCPDGEARHDWRDFQRIKNDTVGDEWEAIELFPAESRLQDPSNYYILYCAQSLPFGMFEPRNVLTPENCIAPQRGWMGEAPS